MKFSKFFSNLQESPWYRQFLNPVIEQIETDSNLLDIGTGSGKMLEILFNEKNVNSIGTDTNKDMLSEAKEKLKNTTVKLHHHEAGERLDFDKESFDYITICSVLFHLKKEEIDSMIVNALVLLKKDGKIIVHTPTGGENFFKLTAKYFSLKNKGIYVWYKATKKRASIWTKELYLKKYSKQNRLNYKREIVMNGFAQIEIIEK